MRASTLRTFADLRPEAEIDAYVRHIEEVIAKCVRVMPTQADYIARNCAAPSA